MNRYAQCVCLSATKSKNSSNLRTIFTNYQEDISPNSTHICAKNAHKFTFWLRNRNSINHRLLRNSEVTQWCYSLILFIVVTPVKYEYVETKREKKPTLLNLEQFWATIKFSCHMRVPVILYYLIRRIRYTNTIWRYTSSIPVSRVIYRTTRYKVHNFIPPYDNKVILPISALSHKRHKVHFHIPAW